MNKKIYIFWHIYNNNSTKCVKIIERQFSKIKESGLLQYCNKIFIGYVSEFPFPCKNILNNNKIKIIKNVNVGYEGVTTTLLKSFCEKLDDNCFILYIHNRGATREESSITDDWTLTMEYFCIINWKKAIVQLKNKYTSGCEMWSHKSRINPNSYIYHYAGNFWWAKSEYIKMLKYPSFENRFVESEDWILQLADHKIPKEKFGVLHYTSRKKYVRGGVNIYKDRYPLKYYKLGNETPDIPIDLSKFHGEHYNKNNSILELIYYHAIHITCKKCLKNWIFSIVVFYLTIKFLLFIKNFFMIF